MAKNTRDYAKNFASGGSVSNAYWQPPAEFEDYYGNPAVAHYDLWGELKPGESPEEELKNSLAHPGRTVPHYNRMAKVFPAGAGAERRKLDSILQDKEKARLARVEASDDPADMAYKAARDDARFTPYAKGGVVKKGKK
jgi:hypothetical protein